MLIKRRESNFRALNSHLVDLLQVHFSVLGNLLDQSLLERFVLALVQVLLLGRLHGGGFLLQRGALVNHVG